MSTTAWSGSEAPYSARIYDSKILSDSNIHVTLDSSATDAQALAYIASVFVPGAINSGSIVLKAYGNKPKVSLPLKLLIYGKEKS